MIKKCTFLTVVFICFVLSSLTHAEDKVVNNQMEAALKTFNPKFVPWKTSDYTTTVQRDAVEHKRRAYALGLDLNGDQEEDLILDGHDDQHNILVCLLSSPNGYDVVVIREMDLPDPKKLENRNDGRNEIGLNYYLWPHKNGKGFTLAYPQQSDSEGRLLRDGAMIDYTFVNGQFHESYQTL